MQLRSATGRPGMGRRPGAILTAVALTTTALATQALQVLDAQDGVAIEAIVSLREPTRIRIEGAPILDLIGNVYQSNCASPHPLDAGLAPIGQPTTPQVNPAGEFVLTCDRDKGEVYLRPVGDSRKPINVFVSSATATYTLLLRQADVPADTIVIRNPAERVRPSSPDRSPRGLSPSHIRSLKALLVAMAGNRVPADLQVQELGQPVQLWAGTRFTLVRRYEGRGLVGELYLLQNTGAAPLELAEQSFDREEGRVAAVAIEHRRLDPGEATSVFVLRIGGTP